MNRTNEYLHIVSAFTTPQRLRPSNFIKNPLGNLHADIQSLTSTVLTAPHTEVRGSIRSIEAQLARCDRLPTTYGDCKHVNDAISEYLSYSKQVGRLSLQKINDLYATRLKREQDHRKHYISTEEGQKEVKHNEMFVIHEQESVTRRESVLENRIEEQITEIGQIITDITLHIHAQGETLKRIDDMMVDNEGYLKGSVFNAKRTWDRIKGRRHGMIVYFIIWILILILIVLIKMIF